MKAIAILLLLLVSTACATKTVYIEQEQWSFQKTELPETVTVRVHNDDVDVYTAYIDYLRDLISFHNEQIDNYLNN